MIKPQHKRTAAASMFQNGISRNTKCAVTDGFRRNSHNCYQTDVPGPIFIAAYRGLELQVGLALKN